MKLNPIKRMNLIDVTADIARIWENAERGKSSIIKPWTALVLRNLALPSIKDKNTIHLRYKTKVVG
jgi:hypothetical protein